MAVIVHPTQQSDVLQALANYRARLGCGCPEWITRACGERHPRVLRTACGACKLWRSVSCAGSRQSRSRCAVGALLQQRPAEPASQPAAVAAAGDHAQPAGRRPSGSLTASARGLPAAGSATAASSSASAKRSPDTLARARGASHAAGQASRAASQVPSPGSAPVSAASAAKSWLAGSGATSLQRASQMAAATASPPEGRQSQRSLATEVRTAGRQSQPQTVGNTAPGLNRGSAARGPSDNREAARHGAADAKPSAEGMQPTAASSAAVQAGADASPLDSAQPRRGNGRKGSLLNRPGPWLHSVPQAIAAGAASVLAASSLAVLWLAWRWRGPAGASSHLSYGPPLLGCLCVDIITMALGQVPGLEPRGLRNV